MKLILDFLPIVLFFISFKWAGTHPDQARQWLEPLLQPLSGVAIQPTQVPILLATVVAIVVTAVLIVIQRVSGKKIETMQWVGLAVIVVFGGATLVLQNETFIKWKPTVLYLAMAVGFAVATLFKKNPIELMMKGQVEMPPAAWTRLLWAWILFFLLMAAANLLVAYNFSTDIWVDFKLFGALGATLVFVIGQGIYMSRHMKPQNGAH
ncbi:septation protein A [Limnobacter humi]|uniref:Inner membrane-spanning protein YciB n=1 Tax=Limnobacter humi TaxID=1778671 RepID=A0ABT1WGS1_9BURK|nr:septation protein A [Limnobacter humi]MCQ8895942.1 septation protein A [Limnobacter humi]